MLEFMLLSLKTQPKREEIDGVFVAVYDDATLIDGGAAMEGG